MGHAVRTCLIAMGIAQRLGLPLRECRDLYYASMLKDVGCSSSSARVFELFGGDDGTKAQQLKALDWNNYLRASRYGLARPGASWFQRARRIATLARVAPSVATELVEIRSDRAAGIVRRLGFGDAVAESVRAIDERWDGSGHPRGLRAGEIPLGSRVIALAQVLEVYAMIGGAGEALNNVGARRAKWFDPTLIVAAEDLEAEIDMWCELDENGLGRAVADREPGGASLIAGPGTLDSIALGFAEIVDAKSPYTASHSFRVTQLSLDIARQFGYSTAALGELKRAALLHDIGKLSVPNSILDKPGPLSADEWETVRLHPYYTQRILDHIGGLERLAFVAASHHERLDGRGYHRGLRAERIPQESQILATADIYDALSAPRPYRPALPQDVALTLMEKDRGIGLLPECLDGLRSVLERGESGKQRAA